MAPEQGSGGLSGNSSSRKSFTSTGEDSEYGSTNAYTDGWQSSAGEKSKETAQEATRETASNAANDVGDKLGNAAGSLGYTFIAGAMTGAKNGAAMLRRMGRSVMNALMPAGGFISRMLGGFISPKTGAVATASVGSLGALFMSAVMISTLFSTPHPPEGVQKCPEFQAIGNASTSAEFEDMEEAAKYIYEAMSGMGISDENIAGVLGNWEAESQLDPTGVETIYDEPYKLGPRKKRAESVGFDVKRIDPAYAARFPAIKQVGIGFGQWTNDGNQKLRKFAEKKGGKWHQADIQLAFMFSKEDRAHVQPYMAELRKNKNKGARSVKKATYEFYERWEGIANTSDTSFPKREKAASKWFAKMGGWQANPALGKSILAMADANGKSANSAAMQQPVAPGCEIPQESISNSDAAEAMAQYVWPKQSKGDNHQNDGTDLYMYVHDNVLEEGDPYYASCDRSVATAVRWSGTDKDLMYQGVSQMYSYFMGPGKDLWKMVGEDLPEKQLKPGDVLIAGDQGHVWMYLSEDVVDKVWKGKDYDKGAMVGSGSLNDRSPTLSKAVNESGINYYVFRNTKKNGSKEYENLKIPPNAKPDHCGSYRPCVNTTRPPG